MDEAGTLVQVTAKGLACGSHDVTVTELPPQSTGGDFAPSLAPPAAAPDPNAPMSVAVPLTVNCPAPGNPRGPGKPGTLSTPGSTGTITPVPTLAVNPQGVIAGMRTAPRSDRQSRAARLGRQPDGQHSRAGHR